MSKQDIYKFKTLFQSKYKEYLKKFGEGLPGGV